jgi:DNA polymerase delta subunit 3
MKDVSDDEEDFVPPAPADLEIVNKNRKERKENEEKLRQMMEMDDEEDEEIVAEVEKPEVKETKKEKEPSVEKEVPPVVSDGRRRGRRRVMKKKTVKDEEGYLGMYHVLAACFILRENSYQGRGCMGVVLGRRASSFIKA